MSDEEENNEENKEEIEENKNEINPEEEEKEMNQENEEKIEENQILEAQNVENLNKNENDEELKDIENDLNQNEINNENQDIIPFEDNGKEILKENEPNDLNIEGEINIENNSIEKDNENNININMDKNSNKENDEQLKNMNEIFKNEITMLSAKKNNTNENMNPENLLSFGKNGYFGENNNNIYNTENTQNKTTYQLLNEINSDMDFLEKELRPIYNSYKIKNDLKYNNYNTSRDNWKNYQEIDQQNREIKELIRKANKLVNNHTYNYYGNRTDNFRENNFNRNNLSEIYQKNKIENGGNYSNYFEGNENSSSENDNSGYIRNISPEKNINKYRIKNISDIYGNNNKRYMIYKQNETYPIKNSYMNEFLGQPQTFQKKEYPNNLVFSSDKIAFRKIKYGGNINQSLNVLFKDQ